MESSASDLQWNAGYGRLPFDLFILVGGFTSNLSRKILIDSKQQWPSTIGAFPVDYQQLWNDLVERYLSLSLLERWVRIHIPPLIHDLISSSHFISR
jgi:hypothetical protein